jgi:hypothetical protein
MKVLNNTCFCGEHANSMKLSNKHLTGEEGKQGRENTVKAN